jgi:hypothetical protein
MRFFKRHKRQLRVLESYSYADFLILFPLCTEESKNEAMAHLNACTRPSFLGEHEVPDSLNHISYGKLDDLSRLQNEKDPFGAAMKILLDMPEAEIYALPVTKVFGFSNFVAKEVERINNLFAAIKLDHTSEEISAGIESLNFGSFGVLDWYARRMRITNQNEVRSVPWVRIYTCMKNDTAQAAYERKYNKIILDNAKRRRR